MPFGMITATYLHAFPIFFTNSRQSHEFYENYLLVAKTFLRVLQGVFGLIFVYFIVTKEKIKKVYPLFQFAFGWIFGLGLMLSGMCSRSKILAFLTISKDWDPSLLVVMFTAVFINLVTFQGIIWYGKPVFENRLQMPVNGVELGSFVGPAFFGIG